MLLEGDRMSLKIRDGTDTAYGEIIGVLDDPEGFRYMVLLDDDPLDGEGYLREVVLDLADLPLDD